MPRKLRRKDVNLIPQGYNLPFRNKHPLPPEALVDELDIHLWNSLPDQTIPDVLQILGEYGPRPRRALVGCLRGLEQKSAALMAGVVSRTIKTWKERDERFREHFEQFCEWGEGILVFHESHAVLDPDYTPGRHSQRAAELLLAANNQRYRPSVKLEVSATEEMIAHRQRVLDLATGRIPMKRKFRNGKIVEGEARELPPPAQDDG